MQTTTTEPTSTETTNQFKYWGQWLDSFQYNYGSRAHHHRQAQVHHRAQVALQLLRLALHARNVFARLVWLSLLAWSWRPSSYETEGRRVLRSSSSGGTILGI